MKGSNLFESLAMNRFKSDHRELLNIATRSHSNISAISTSASSSVKVLQHMDETQASYHRGISVDDIIERGKSDDASVSQTDEEMTDVQVHPDTKENEDIVSQVDTEECQKKDENVSSDKDCNGKQKVGKVPSSVSEISMVDDENTVEMII